MSSPFQIVCPPSSSSLIIMNGLWTLWNSKNFRDHLSPTKIHLATIAFLEDFNLSILAFFSNCRALLNLSQAWTLSQFAMNSSSGASICTMYFEYNFLHYALNFFVIMSLSFLVQNKALATCAWSPWPTTSSIACFQAFNIWCFICKLNPIWLLRLWVHEDNCKKVGKRYEIWAIGDQISTLPPICWTWVFR